MSLRLCNSNIAMWSTLYFVSIERVTCEGLSRNLVWFRSLNFTVSSVPHGWLSEFVSLQSSVLVWWAQQRQVASQIQVNEGTHDRGWV